MADFTIRRLNGGEIAIAEETDRARQARRLEAGTMLAFKTSEEARPYVEAAEEEGFTFSGKEALGRRIL